LPEEARTMVKKYLPWVILALLIFYAANEPTAAAQDVRALGSGFANIATGFGAFFSALA
jgi:hypothetical protein